MVITTFDSLMPFGLYTCPNIGIKHLEDIPKDSKRFMDHYKKSGFRRRFKNVTKNPKNVTIDTNGL